MFHYVLVTEIDVVSANKLEVIPSIESKKDFKDALRTYMKKYVIKINSYLKTRIFNNLIQV